MEWSLVLASQGIAATIQPADDAQGWRLLVPETAFRPATAAIRQYVAENRQSRWQHSMPGTGLMIDMRAATWCLLWAILFAMEQTRWPRLRTEGIMDSMAVNGGEWWRLFTAEMLHADPAHLAANMVTGLILLGLAMGAYGFGWAVLASFLGGALGNLAGWILYDDTHRSLGASGMVMGALGLLTVQTLALGRTGQPRLDRLLVRAVFGGILLLVLMGFSPQSDIIAHVGGFFGGGLLGVALQFLPVAVVTGHRANRLAELATIGIMLVCWWLALR